MFDLIKSIASKLGLKPKKPWYAGGLKFQCTQCGKCCTGVDGEVPLLPSDRSRLADFLKISLRDFDRRFTHVSRNRIDIRILTQKTKPHKGNYGDCIFLERDEESGKAKCSVHPAKPTQCAAWPFWPTSLKNQQSWNSASEHCPGMNRGEDTLSCDEIQRRLNALHKLEKKVGHLDRGWS